MGHDDIAFAHGRAIEKLPIPIAIMDNIRQSVPLIRDPLTHEHLAIWSIGPEPVQTAFSIAPLTEWLLLGWPPADRVLAPAAFARTLVPWEQSVAIQPDGLQRDKPRFPAPHASPEDVAVPRPLGRQ